MEDDLDVSMIGDGLNSFSMENLFDDNAAKKSHEDLLALLVSNDASIESDLFSLLEVWFSANEEGYGMICLHPILWMHLLINTLSSHNVDFAFEISIQSSTSLII